MSKASKRATETEGYRNVLSFGYFPNGVPKVVEHYEVREGIRFVIGQGGEMIPVLENEWFMLDFKKGMNIFNYFYLRPAHGYDPNAPMVEDHSTDYANSEREAALLAVSEQKRLAEIGAYVPIYIRE